MFVSHHAVNVVLSADHCHLLVCAETSDKHFNFNKTFKEIVGEHLLIWKSNSLIRFGPKEVKLEVYCVFIPSCSLLFLLLSNLHEEL